MSPEPLAVRATRGSARLRWLVAGTLALAFVVPAGCGREGSSRERPNLVLVTLDTTRRDRLGPYGYERPTTPRLDELARDAVVYDRAWSTSSWTLPAHASLFTGKFPKSHGARYDPEGGLVLRRAIRGPEGWKQIRARGLAAGETTLAALLSTAGWRTGAVVGGPWLKRVFGLNRGFQDYDDSGIGTLNGRGAASVTDAALAWIAEAPDAPFFLFLNYYDPHTPFVPTREFLAAVAPREEWPRGRAKTPVEFSALYDAEIRGMDHHLGRFIDALRERGLYDETWIVVTADHGELLGEQSELMGEEGSQGHGRSLFEPELRVPLLVKAAAGGPPPGRSEEPMQLVDVFSLVLAALGVERPEGSAEPGAHPIFAEVYPMPQIAPQGSWRALIDGDAKLLASSSGKTLLFDLAADPHELRNLAFGDPQRVRALAARLNSFQSALPRAGPSGDAQEIDAETREALENLGYLD